MYCITRSNKIKDYQTITNMAEHNFRLRKQSNIDEAKSHNNKVMFNSLNADLSKGPNFGKSLKAFYQKLENSNPDSSKATKVALEKSDSVLCVETIITASPDFFEGKSDEEIHNWADIQLQFMKKTFGDNLKLGVLHLDEKTPHMHFIFTPEEKKVRTYKNRYGEKKVESWVLNNKRFNPEFFKQMHTDLAAANTIFGLQRGQKGSSRLHVPLKEFYMKMEKEQRELENKLAKIDDLKKFKAAFPELKKTILSNYEYIKELLNILEDKELTLEQEEKIEKISKKIPKPQQPEDKKTKGFSNS